MSVLNRSKDVRIEEDIDFSTLIQNQSILKGLDKSGYARPSPIQLKAIPLGRLGVDLIAQAKSGTGKTVVFGVIALEAIQLRIKSPQVLMIAPTREIALQIRDVVQNLGQCMSGFKCGVFIGGLSLKGDIQRLPQCQVLVCTPGRLMWLLENKLLSTNTIKLLVLDEADKLMTEAFKDQINYIYKKLPVNKQTVAFSATFTNELMDSLNQYVNHPQIVKLTYDTPILEEVQQYYVKINTKNIPKDNNQGNAGHFLKNMRIYKAKFEKAAEILSKVDFYQCMIFVNSFPQANELSKWLTEMGWQSGHICAGISQEKRIQVMNSMRQFKMRVLVCSDLIARGIDIDRVNLVINMDYPRDIETYHHRVGRSGRYVKKMKHF
ncbi:P-loop containing nucleoside triphosphate hydrolase protein [Cunninghamella echinulata]|nr:P-loop containing nucleoside triphosphate hydrolase protein [Cunninghamella echinulata]